MRRRREMLTPHPIFFFFLISRQSLHWCLSNGTCDIADKDSWAGCFFVFFGRVKAQGSLNGRVSSVLSVLPAKQKKHEPPAYLGLTHALHSLTQTHLRIHLCGHTKRHMHTHSLENIPRICYEEQHTASDANTISCYNSHANHFPYHTFQPPLPLFMSFNSRKQVNSCIFVPGDGLCCCINSHPWRQRKQKKLTCEHHAWTRPLIKTRMTVCWLRSTFGRSSNLSVATLSALA